MKKLLEHLKNNVKFYSDISIEDLETIPIVDKKTIKRNYDLFISNKLENRQAVLKSLMSEMPIQNYVIEKEICNGYMIEWTTGSSGIPFKCVKSVRERKNIALRMWRRRRKIDKIISINRFFPLIHTGMKSINYDVRDYKTENIKQLYEYIRDNNFSCIHTTPNLISRHIYKSGLPIDFFNNIVPYIEVTGSYLTDKDRKIIERVFNAKVLNMYGLIEVWGIGYTCKCGKMHILEDNVFVEVVDQGGKSVLNSVGEIVVTSLNQYIMPFVRYKTGDIGYIDTKKCECGSEDRIIVLNPERILNSLFLEGKYENGIIFVKQILRKIYWTRDFPEILYICLVQKEKKQSYTFVLNLIGNRKSFESIAISVLRQQLGSVDVHFKYMEQKEYDIFNPKGYLFLNRGDM